MHEIAIKVEAVSKLYKIGKSFNADIRDNISRNFKSLFFNNTKQEETDFWALKDVSFEVKKGEAIGIIGRNGAGKSTLLKILSRITEPTKGSIKINGKVSSLLEVGTGFHPELTGRENIYLNGTILGMKRSEIKERFDEIVEFSEIERFIDTPVKRYSSGMYVRLAFAVAAHLEPDILIVDEVLAVGDFDFQKKCLGKMNDVSKNRGLTVLFVSHSMAAIMNLCPKCILLDRGTIISQGDSKNIIYKYLNSEEKNLTEGEIIWKNGIFNTGIEDFKLNSIRLSNQEGLCTKIFSYNESFKVEIGYSFLINISYCRVGFVLSNAEGIPLFEIYDTDNNDINERGIGDFISSCTIPGYFLNIGKYFFQLMQVFLSRII